MTGSLLADLAAELLRAQRTHEPVSPISLRYPDLGLLDAYRIQELQAQAQTEEGRKLLGFKIGLTSAEAQKHFKLFHPDFGRLFDSMQLPSGGTCPLDSLIQPKIEGEIAFTLGADLLGPGLTLQDVILAVGTVRPALEIIDSRIKDWKIAAVDTIADNGSSAYFVLGGNPKPLKGLELPFLGMAFSRNGEVVMTGSGGAVMGNPLEAVLFLGNELGKQGVPLKAGQVILSGAVSGVLPLERGDTFEAEFLHLGSVSVRCG